MLKKSTKPAKGFIGIDEVGRGPLAGPVTVGAVYISDPKAALSEYFGNTIRDSKKLSICNRINIYLTIRKNKKNKSIIYAVSSRDAKYVDKHGITKAIHSCMLECLRKLEKKGVPVFATPIRLDGGLRIQDSSLQQEAFIKGDEKYVEIALASIVAKVTRDTYMKKLAKDYPAYGFETNVGYGTKIHKEAIKKHGITKYHRLTYL